MYEISENSLLVKHLVGKEMPFKKALIRGISVGIAAFGVFEGISLVNSNVPRVPVQPWLLSFAVTIIQIVLFLKIMLIIRKPRTEDFLFVLGLSYQQRKEIAHNSFTAVHRTIFPFTISASFISVLLEIVIIKERSIINLAIAPAVLLGLNYGIFVFGKYLLRRNIFGVTKKDERNSGFVLFSSESIRRQFSAFILKTASFLAASAPQKLQPLVKRNILYLLRSDPFLFPFINTIAPIFLLLFMLLIGNFSSLFMDFFDLLCIFVLNYYFASHLQEASAKYQECPYYDYSPRKLLLSHFATALLFAIPYVLIFIGVLNIHLFSFSGIMRLFTYSLALVATLLINCRAVLTPDRKDSDSATDFLLFVIGVGSGIFIPYYGGIFEIATIAAVCLLEWESFTNKKTVVASTEQTV